MLGSRCVFCRSYDLAKEAAQYVCPDCGCVFPIIGGVGVMFDDVTLSPGTRPDPEAAQQILHAFGLPADSAEVEQLRDYFAQKVTFGGELIQIEAAQFLERVRNSGHQIENDRPPAAQFSFGRPQDGFIKPRWILHHIPRLLPPGQALMGNIRFDKHSLKARLVPKRAAC